MSDEARSLSSTRRFPPMGAVAVMAHALAVERTGYDGMFLRDDDGSQRPGFDRDRGYMGSRHYWLKCEPLSSTTAEYYHIIARIERGERP